MTRLTFYFLGTLIALVMGMWISMFSFGAYTMQEMCLDVFVIVSVVIAADCLLIIIGETFFKESVKEEE